MSLRRTFYASLPQHLLSRLAGWVAGLKAGGLTTRIIRDFARHYGVNFAEAQRGNPADYVSFTDFFVRSLCPGVRRWPAEPRTPASPVDGMVSTAGTLDSERLLQAKGVYYTVAALTADPALANRCRGGEYATLYLRPGDYHRVHAPLAGELRRIRYIPGRLWPVRPWAVREIPELFARNERLVMEIVTPAGTCLVIMVGALMVGGLETVITGPIRRGGRNPRCWDLNNTRPCFQQGDELGRFNFGSTVILLFSPGMVNLDKEVLVNGHEIRLGEALGRPRAATRLSD